MTSKPRISFTTKFPSYWVAAVGALLVALSSTIGTILLQDLDSDIFKTHYNVDFLITKREKYWRDVRDIEQGVFRSTLLLHYYNKEQTDPSRHAGTCSRRFR